uniref:Uncharacterized protein n=1 Tax=Cacopsylla melanoneura TaxID=428564 RepID=A0A8D8YUC8_9HEMI
MVPAGINKFKMPSMYLKMVPMYLKMVLRRIQNILMENRCDLLMTNILESKPAEKRKTKDTKIETLCPIIIETELSIIVIGIEMLKSVIETELSIMVIGIEMLKSVIETELSIVVIGIEMLKSVIEIE